MSEQYFTAKPSAEHKKAEVRFAYRGHALTLETDSGVFSRTELDRGTEILLNALPDEIVGRALDLGCGYGPIGLAVKAHNPQTSVTMADVNERAAALAQRNAERSGLAARVVVSDGLSALSGERFDTVLTNPPIRAGKQVIYRLFAQARDALTGGGRLYVVIRKQQGAPSALKYLGELFPEASVVAREAGFWVIRCTKGMDTE